MPPPAHTDPKKWAAMQGLAERYLSKSAVENAGLLNHDGVKALFDLHDREDTTAATRNNLDAVFNHMIGVQVLHQQFVATDVPRHAREKAEKLGWAA
jgi:asparagine synthase (glutamine-hydrolysing)